MIPDMWSGQRYMQKLCMSLLPPNVTVAMEATRNSRSSLLNGTVVAIESVPSSTKKRAVTLIIADYALGGGTIKRHQLNSRCVKAGEAPLLIVAEPQPVNEPVTQNSDSIDNPNVVLTAPNNVPTNPMGAELHNNNNTVALAPSVDAPARLFIQNPLVLPAVEELSRVNPIDIVLATGHGTDWVRASRNDLPLNGNVPFCQWGVRNVVGDFLYPGGQNGVGQDQMSPIDFFLLMFPPKQLGDCDFNRTLSLESFNFVKEVTIRLGYRINDVIKG